jgi:hypothetical protein
MGYAWINPEREGPALLSQMHAGSSFIVGPPPSIDKRCHGCSFAADQQAKTSTNHNISR